MTLFGYDEIVGYVFEGENRTTDPRLLAYLLFITSLSNLYFIAFTIMEMIFDDRS
jgi:hypothetical protein